jgi:hypothetical protein
MDWFLILIIFALMAIPYAMAYRQNNKLTEAERKKREEPWWIQGIYVAFPTLLLCDYIYDCVYERSAYSRLSYNPFVLIMLGFSILMAIGQFIYLFIKQHAQYTIRDILVLTLIVAVFCSIYATFGWRTMFNTAALLMFCIIFVYVKRKAKN